MVNKIIENINLLKDPRMCSLRVSESCSTDDFAIYKLVLTLYFLCVANKITYEKLMHENEYIFLHAVNGEIYNLTRKYKVSNIRSLYLEGPLAQTVVRKTFSDLTIMKDPNQIISLKDFSMKDKTINDWIDYKFKKIGDPSAYGVVTSSKLQQSGPDLEFIIKINKLKLKIPIFNR